jgi:hypothetical protein
MQAGPLRSGFGCGLCMLHKRSASWRTGYCEGEWPSIAKTDTHVRSGIQREQHRPEQNQGHDEAARGGTGMPTTNVGTSPDQRVTREDEFDRAAREAANDVRRRESSAE